MKSDNFWAPLPASREVLESLGITAVLNVSSSCPNYFEGHFLYKSIPVEDNHMADISVWFQEAIDFIASPTAPSPKDSSISLPQRSSIRLTEATTALERAPSSTSHLCPIPWGRNTPPSEASKALDQEDKNAVSSP
ncbi:Dual specificity protein phosphatase 1, partial [Ophiophagus hannah]